MRRRLASEPVAGRHASGQTRAARTAPARAAQGVEEPLAAALLLLLLFCCDSEPGETLVPARDARPSDERGDPSGALLAPQNLNGELIPPLEPNALKYLATCVNLSNFVYYYKDLLRTAQCPYTIFPFELAKCILVPMEQVLFVVYRGTELMSSDDLTTDCKTATDKPFGRDQGCVHRGFWERSSLNWGGSLDGSLVSRDTILATILQPRFHRVIFTGHSLGGSTAICASIRYLEHCRQAGLPTSFYCYTFGAPICMDETMACRYSMHSSSFFNFILLNDPIPTILNNAYGVYHQSKSTLSKAWGAGVKATLFAKEKILSAVSKSSSEDTPSPAHTPTSSSGRNPTDSPSTPTERTTFVSVGRDYIISSWCYTSAMHAQEMGIFREEDKIKTDHSVAIYTKVALSIAGGVLAFKSHT